MISVGITGAALKVVFFACVAAVFIRGAIEFDEIFIAGPHNKTNI